MASPGSIHTEGDEAAVFCLLTDIDSDMTESEAIIGPASVDNLNTASNHTITTMTQSGMRADTAFALSREMPMMDEKTHSQSVGIPTCMLDGDEKVHDDEDDEELEEEKEKKEEEGEGEEGSELSDGEDIRDDLHDALSDANFDFSGSFYHAGILTAAPNPCLQISGLGLVGMPLSERDAKALISCATLAPFGDGERTIVDKEVRDTWEIEPERIVFGNSEWVNFINGTVCNDVCKALGVSVGISPPRMELYKLLLYETGSHFLPHQDTQKAKGMFATVVVILPSAYTGGQVVVSHPLTTKTIDFAPNSLLSTAVLAWYTDVKHEVKPVTAGYRLALSYNLIHTARVPKPLVPQMEDSVTKLRNILRKWSKDRYEKCPETPLLAYILDYEYSNNNLKEGVQALKGADAHRVTFLRQVAEDLGYMVGLARLKHCASGPGIDSGRGYHIRRRQYGDVPEMKKVSDTTTSISGLVDLNGVSILPYGEINIGDDNVIQKDAFDDEVPDGREYEGYMGNHGGDVQHWYHRTALVIVHERNADCVCPSVRGISYAFKKLAAMGAEKSTVPTAGLRLWVDRVVEESLQLDEEQAIKMINIAINWKDAKMFNTVMKNPFCVLGVLNMDILSTAWKAFSFENVKLSFEELLARSMQFSAKMNTIYSIKSEAAPEERVVVDAWCKKESDKVLSSYAQPQPQDIPTILSVIRIAGWFAFTTVLLPCLAENANFVFWIAFLKALRENRPSLLGADTLAKSSSESTTNPDAQTHAEGVVSKTGGMLSSGLASPEDENVVDALIDKILKTVAKQWSLEHLISGYVDRVSYGCMSFARTMEVERIIEIIDQAIICDNMEVCRTLFVDILKSTGTSAEKFKQIYNPLVPRLRNLLRSNNRDICSTPFLDLFQIFIGTHLRDILGKKPQLSNPRLRKIGCGCADCQQLDKFILNPTTETETFRLAQVRRTHLENQIVKARDLCSYETIKYGNPHGLQVTKCPEVVEASMWGQKQNAAKLFLASIGTDDVIKRIMGGRYTDVVAAINGTMLFGAKAAVTKATGLNTTAGSSIPNDAHRSAQVPASRSTAAAPAPATSRKRKASAVDLRVDLS